MKQHQRTAALFGIFLLLLLTVGSWYRQRVWHEREQQHLAVGLASLKTGYQATINAFELTTQIYFNEIINQPATIALMAAGLNRRGIERDLARKRLSQLLSPSYARLRSHGLHHLHFHFPDGSSFLRFQRPEPYSDTLSEGQPPIRLVNTLEKPTRGFEVGGSGAAFRYVYPVIANGVHLGGVDLGISFKTLRDELTRLSPFNEFAFILDRTTAEPAIADQPHHYSESALHPDFLVEDSGVNLPDSLPPPSSQAQAINRQLRHNLDFQNRLRREHSFALAIAIDQRPYAVSFLRIHDIKGHAAGYLIAYAPDPFLRSLKSEFISSLIIAWILLAGIGLLFVLLACSRGRYKRERGELKAIAETMLDGLYVTDLSSRITLVNPAACDILGYRPEELLDQQTRDSWQSAEIKKEVLINGKTFTGQTEFETAGGALLPVEIAVAPLTNGDKIINGAVTVFRDISTRLQQEAELKRLATTDPLTGLANRRCFLERLDQELLRLKRYGVPTALLMLDLDYFKRVNDTHGHGVGDEILRQFADFARRLVREVDMVGRLGGEEFAVLLPDTGVQGAIDSAERLRCVVADRLQNGMCAYAFKTSAGEIVITVSIGVTLFASGDDTPDLALKRADLALYRAKGNGRNRVEIELPAGIPPSPPSAPT